MLLLTAYNNHQAPLGELTIPLMEQYAKRHRLGFRCVRFEEPNVKEAYWKKITLTLQAFDEGFDRVFWLDADQMITNMEAEPPYLYITHDEETTYFTASRDWGNDAKQEDFSMCGWLLDSEGRHLFEKVNARHDECINGAFPEQTPMREECAEDEAKNNRETRIWIQGRRVFNAVPDEVSPGNIPEPWQPGDFAAHLTMLPIGDGWRCFTR